MLIRSVLKALEILETFSVKEPLLGVADISRRLRMPTSTVQRLLATLETKAYVEQDPTTQKFRLGVASARLANTAIGNRDVRTVALPIMRRLRDETNETVHLNVRHGYYRLMIECLESFQELRVSNILAQSPLYAGASARVLLAALSDDEITAYLSVEQLSRLTPQTLQSTDQLWEQIRETRRLGYARSYGERIPGVVSFSAPVRDVRGEVIASLSLTVPSVRFEPSAEPRFVAQLLSAARAVSQTRGYKG